MKNLIWFFVAFVFFLYPLNLHALEKNVENIYFFYGQGCAHCARVESYLQKNDIYEKFGIDAREIYFNEENREFYTKLLDEKNIPLSKRGVPIIIVDDTAIIGDVPIIAYFEGKSTNFGSDLYPTQTNHSNLTLPLVVGASLVDAINPCAFAVLIILISTILTQENSKQSRKALFSGLAFSVSIFISYLLMGLGLYKAIGLIGNYGFVMRFFGLLAVILGVLNLKDWLFYGKGFLMEVPLSWRPYLKKLINSVTNPKGAFAIGFLVSLFLLPCTSGPYIVILGMLSQRTQFVTAVMYLIIYNLVFISPMLLLTLLFYKGLDVQKTEEMRKKWLRILHLIAGLILFSIGVVILGGWI